MLLICYYQLCEVMTRLDVFSTYKTHWSLEIQNPDREICLFSLPEYSRTLCSSPELTYTYTNSHKTVNNFKFFLTMTSQ